MLIKKSIGILMLASVSNFASANIWMPTSADSNFFSFANLFNPQTPNTFGIFEDTVSVNSASPIVQFDSTALVAFTEQANKCSGLIVPDTLIGDCTGQVQPDTFFRELS